MNLNIFQDQLTNLYNAFDQLDVKYRITLFMGSLLVSWVVPYLHRWLNRIRIKILDNQLIYGPAPGIELKWWEKKVIIPLLTPWINMGWRCGIMISFLMSIYCLCIQQYIWMGIALIIVLVMMVVGMAIPHLLKRDSKGLVGILSTEFEGVERSEFNEKNRIHLVHLDLNPEKDSYETRQPFSNETEIKEMRNKHIVTYYDELKKEIEQKCKGKYHELFMIEWDKKPIHICDFLKDIAYSTTNLMEKVNEVDRQMKEEKRINFIGDKIGVGGYYLKGYGKKKVIKLKTYLTDHFTFLVFKEIFHDAKYKEIFQLFIRRVNRVDEPVKEYMVQCLKFLFSSFGVDLIIHGRNAQGKQAMLVALRNGDIEREGHNKLHVPVNESFSKTDLIQGDYGKDNCDLEVCVKRGILEELGIPTELLEKATITFHDFAIVSDEGEIGMGCHIDFTGIMPIEEARCYAGQDKYMEMKGLYEVPYPPFFWNSEKYPAYFYKITKNDHFSTPWESFTPLLYQRCIVRNLKLSKIKKLCLNTLFLLIFTSIAMAIFYKDYGTKWTVYLVTSIFTLVLNLTIEGLIQLYKNITYYKYDYIMPLVPQWGGDVTVLQSNGNIAEKKDTKNNIIEHQYFAIDQKITNEKALSQLRIVEKPYCYVRRECSSDKSETPITFYRTDLNEKDKNKYLHLYTVPCYLDNNELLVGIQVTFKKGKAYYHFIKEIEKSDEPKLKFGIDIEQVKLNNFSKYYSLEKDLLNNYSFAKFPTTFKNKYVPLDLMEYKDNYHWSLRENNPIIPYNANIHAVNKKTQLYNHYIKKVENNETLWLKGDKEILCNALTTFINHPTNRKRINPLDIYMLQLTLIRMGILLAVKKKSKFKYISESTQKELYKWNIRIEKFFKLC